MDYQRRQRTEIRPPWGSNRGGSREWLFLQELGDVDLVVPDLQAAARAVVHHHVARADAGGPAGGSAAGAAAVEAGRDHRDAHLILEPVAAQRAEDDVGVL